MRFLLVAELEVRISVIAAFLGLDFGSCARAVETRITAYIRDGEVAVVAVAVVVPVVVVSRHGEVVIAVGFCSIVRSAKAHDGVEGVAKFEAPGCDGDGEEDHGEGEFERYA